MIFLYNASYDSKTLRGTDMYPGRPWDISKEVLKYTDKKINLLDIGCGTAFKLIPLAPHVRQITGIDISENMLSTAKKIIKKNHINNIQLLLCDSTDLPFKNNTYDIITCMLSKWNIEEIYRVLKPNGIAIIEHIGCHDKKDFKKIFGKDNLGWRGQFLEYSKKSFIAHFKKIISKHFDNIYIKEGSWQTFYTLKGLIKLLKFTPMIRNFDMQKDKKSLKKAYNLFKNGRGILLTQNRILIHVKKIEI